MSRTSIQHTKNRIKYFIAYHKNKIRLICMSCINMNNKLTVKETDALFGLVKLKRNKLDSNSQKRKCSMRSTLQINMLYKVYVKTTILTSCVRRDLSVLLNLSEKSIQIWFRNMREHISPSQVITTKQLTSKDILDMYITERKLQMKRGYNKENV